MIGIMALSGVIMVLAIFVTLQRIMDMRVVFGYATEIDVLFSVALVVVFSGTYIGLMAAAFAGLTLAVLLTIGRVIYGYTRYRVVRYKWRIGVAKVYTPPMWKDGIRCKVSECKQNVKDWLASKWIQSAS